MDHRERSRTVRLILPLDWNTNRFCSHSRTDRSNTCARQLTNPSGPWISSEASCQLCKILCWTWQNHNWSLRYNLPIFFSFPGAQFLIITNLERRTLSAIVKQIIPSIMSDGTAWQCREAKICWPVPDEMAITMRPFWALPTVQHLRSSRFLFSSKNAGISFSFPT